MQKAGYLTRYPAEEKAKGQRNFRQLGGRGGDKGTKFMIFFKFAGKLLPREGENKFKLAECLM